LRHFKVSIEEEELILLREYYGLTDMIDAEVVKYALERELIGSALVVEIIGGD